MNRALFALLLLIIATASRLDAAEQLRIATYNIAMYGERAGGLADRLRGGNDPRAKGVAEVIQRVRPDVLLLCEIDYEADGAALRLFTEKYLGVSQGGQLPVEFAHTHTGPVNTGVPSGLDLDNDRRTDGPADAWGYGRYRGQYGMAVLSRLPIDADQARSFRNLTWSSVPNARRPVRPGGESFYDDATWNALRLSSKSFWDIPVQPPGGRRLHLLCSHPTPPSFDGPEDRNGRRNADEIRLVADYAAGDPAGYLVDDRGGRGGLDAGAPFVVLGDLNADPVDGNSIDGAIHQLLDHPRIDSSRVPTSRGAIETSNERADLNADGRGDPAHDTSDFSGDKFSNLRVDYALPSRTLRVIDTGVFWPQRSEPGAEAARASDHRLVWVDVEVPDAPAANRAE
jgi:endonuclease/exonuclease/phosphatase family metal-dependent hydrolase